MPEPFETPTLVICLTHRLARRKRRWLVSCSVCKEARTREGRIRHVRPDWPGPAPEGAVSTPAWHDHKNDSKIMSIHFLWLPTPELRVAEDFEIQVLNCRARHDKKKKEDQLATNSNKPWCKRPYSKQAAEGILPYTVRLQSSLPTSNMQ